MPEAPLPDPSSDVPSSNLSDTEWTDESGFEDSVPVPEALPPEAEATTSAQENADVADAEWTDESGFHDSVPVPAPPPLEAQVATDVWDAGTSDWLEDPTDPPLAAAAPTIQDALTWLKPLGRRSRTAWQRLLRGIRGRIPAAANLSDSVLSGLLIGILVLLLTLINGVRPPAVAAPPPAPEPTSSPELPAIPEVEVPASRPATPTLPDAASSPLDTAAAALQSDRIANLQAQLTDSTILNAKRVIDSVQADFTANRLTLIVNGDWYRLSDYDQTQLAQQLMTQAADLAFTTLELQTTTGELIARTPVIGDEMVIFSRSAPPVVEPPPRPRYRLTVDR
ncbi:MAG: hypothetical protein AAF773_13690 [Cyanobacteria bacterium P01_D01_bin.115]